MKVDLLIRNGRVIDPSQNLNGHYDLAIREGQIVGLYEKGKTTDDQGMNLEGKEMIDAEGYVVTPGLIDLHAHVFPTKTNLGVPADQVGVEQGVTTVVDAGSVGLWSFDAFLEEAVYPSVTRVLAFLNISGDGLCTGGGELADMSRLTPREAAALIRKQPILRGIKARMSGSVVKQNCIQPLLIAKEAAREAGVPMMVHIGNAPPKLTEILPLLDRGDVVTHAFHGKKGGMFDERGELIPEAQDALERGVLLDIGHGEASFSFQTLRHAQAQGIMPHVISTDVHQRNIDGPVHSLTHTLTKFLAMGYSLEEVIAASTLAPARILGLENEIGTLKVGACADVSILQIRKETTMLTDSEQETLETKERVAAYQAITSGKVLTCK
ncbi:MULTISPECIES: amidohydrolase/deacetylase family metallohydrolase [Brevibacillus]|uniref:amidohydrolase/deacetylase family metallohydrolase n=1 Tax=Brevibacillus TaxID=55080 RepID=UPI000D0EAEF4|nr:MULTISPECIES: amidohydrolase/deacetylase family metallohydrolase [Brevibacillus]MED1943763.1 amidohydrolase/deacetylase family metallohydrolase [Brevibacillus formosus]MED1999865.1 amidohydrolase/deacetylase family metallohydrolase [Brevibacillus formosus]MED2081998.1 amidohydrolase/deacetylase family metallohydrolase [Brevibacillus formosus]PSK19063.1 amidohydrolase/deacetylase family metallohydrolase [Brevibacillus sp. NRRL NRS-603]